MRNLTVVLVTCKNEDDPIKSKGASVATKLYIVRRFFRCLWADSFVVSDEILQKFELTQAFMHVLNTCKYEEDRVKNEDTRVSTRFLPL